MASTSVFLEADADVEQALLSLVNLTLAEVEAGVIQYFSVREKDRCDPSPFFSFFTTFHTEKQTFDSTVNQKSDAWHNNLLISSENRLFLC